MKRVQFTQYEMAAMYEALNAAAEGKTPIAEPHQLRAFASKIGKCRTLGGAPFEHKEQS